MHPTYEVNLSKLVSLCCLLVALCASLSIADSDDQRALYSTKVSLDNLESLIAAARALDSKPDTSAGEPRRNRFRLGEVTVDRRSDSNGDQEQLGLAGMKQDSSMGSQKKRAEKMALKKRLHKMVEQMVENQYPADEQTGEQQSKPERSAKRKKWQSSGSDQDDKVMILVKKPSSYLEAADSQGADRDNLGGGALNLALRNYINGQASSAPLARDLRERSAQRPLVTVGEHERRVNNDGFGILRESVFTTNNHLGLKGVPKFGSDEEY